MAQKTLNDVIKALNQNARDQAYDAMEDKRTQEQVLKEIASLNKMLSTYFMKEKAGAGDDLEEKREAQQKSAKRQKQENKGGTFKSGLREGLGLDFLKNLAGLPGMLFSGVLGGTLVSSLLPAFGKILGRTLLRGPLFGLLAVFGEDLVKKGLESITGIELTGEQATQLNDTLKESIGLSILSRRLGLARLVGGVIGMGLDKLFDLDDKAKGELFGIELPISKLDLATYGATIAAFFGPSLIAGALTKAFTGKTPTDGDKGKKARLKPGLASSFRNGFVTRGGLGWGAVVAGLGITAGTVIGDAIGSEDVGNAVGDALVTAGLVGAFFGPKGAIITALTVMAFKGLGALGEWLRGRSDKVTTEIENKLSALDTKNVAEIGGEDLKNVERTLAEAQREAERLAQLVGRQNEERAAELQKEIRKKRLELGVTQSTAPTFAEDFMSGNRESGEKLLKFYDEKYGGSLEPGDFQNLGMDLAGNNASFKEILDLTKALQNLYSEMYKVNFANPNFELPSTEKGFLDFGPKSLFGRRAERKRLEDYQNLLPPRIPSEGGGGAIIDGSTTTNNHSSNGVLLPAGPAVDTFSPYAT